MKTWVISSTIGATELADDHFDQIIRSFAQREGLCGALLMFGVAVLPTTICAAYLGSELVPLLADYQKPVANIYAVYPSKKYLSPKVSRFLDFLCEHMG